MEVGPVALVPERMTENAYERLYEAVNTSRLIGFIGAGFSPIYGNLTWADFIDEMLARLRQGVEARIAANKSKRIPLDAHTVTDLNRVMAQIKAVKDCDVDEGIVVLEFVRQSFRLIDSAGDEPGAAYREAMHDLFSSNKVFVSRLSATRLELAGFKVPKVWVTKDERLKGKRLKDLLNMSAEEARAQADSALLGDELKLLFPDGAARKGESGPKTVGDAIYRLSPSLYSIPSIEALVKCLDAARWPQLRTLRRMIVKSMKIHERGKSLPIDRRSVMIVFLAAVVLDLQADAMAELRKTLLGFQKDAHPARPLLDPLRSLAENLAIHRYVTTNYDEELEHLFMYDDLQESDRSVSLDARRAELLKRPEFERTLDDAIITRYRADGVRVQSIVNDGKHTAPLIEFGMGPSDNSILIYHHHGRQDLRQTLIAADGEYNRMYRAEGLNRPSLDRAYDAMIEGNPVLFIGSGMTEAELTRTLRSRVSNQRSPTDSPAFVLRAAKGLPHELMREQMNLATKLDLRVIHYGHPRRGHGFSLREHLILIDYLAERFLWPGRGEMPPNLRKYWKREIATPTKEELGNLKAFLAEVNRHAGEPRPDRIMGLLTEKYGLIADLEFDHHLVWWILCEEGKDRAETLAAHFATLKNEAIAKIEAPAKTQQEKAARLFLDYLRQLVHRINTAALRHELRQIGREAKDFFKRKSREIRPRPSRPHARGLTGAWVRHMAVPYAPAQLEEDAVGPNVADWDWAPLGTTPPIDRADKKFDLATAIGRPGEHLRAIVIGDRGVGKGTYLRHLYQDMKDFTCPRLVINCSYGQETDSLVTLIREFLNLGAAERTVPDGPTHSRRSQISGWKPRSVEPKDRPLIVIGAVDRLFGTDNQPMGADFDWLLRTLCRPEMEIDLVITASGRCRRYFEELGEEGRKVNPLRMYRVSSKDQKASISGFLKHCSDRVALFESGLSHSDPDGTRRLMRHEHRREDYLIGRLIENLRGRRIDKAAIKAAGFAGHARLARVSIGGLAQEMLKALAFIGLPCEAEVLMVVPAVRREIARLLAGIDGRPAEAPSGDHAPSARGLIERKETCLLFNAALHALLRDNLIGLIEPHVPAKDTGGHTEALPESVRDVKEVIEKRYRLVLHRLVTRVVRKRFGVPLTETVLSNSFNLTLYAAQLDDAPIFTPEITNELEQMLDHLLGGWRDVWIDEALWSDINMLRKALVKPDIYADNALAPDLLVRLRRFDQLLRMTDPVVPASLRAANGLVRAFFSSVNLLGLDLQDPRSRSDGQSVLTSHNRRLRLLLDTTIEAQNARTAWENSLAVTPKQHIPKNLPDDEDARRKPRTLARALDIEFAVDVMVSLKDKTVTVNGIPRRKVERESRRPNRASDWPGKSAEALRLLNNLRLRTAGIIFDPVSRTPEVAFVHRMDMRLRGEKDEAALAHALTTPPVLQTAPLFEEEIVWLLNERGMLFLAQGNLYAAGTAFQLAENANAQIEGRCFHPNRCRLLVNQSLLWIERGRIADARRALTEMRLAIEHNTNDALKGDSPEGKLIMALSTGYLALCDQLNGLVKRADKGYRSALRQLSGLGHKRSIALFEFHRGSLLQTQVNCRDDAAACFERGVSAAEGGRHTDVLYRIRIAQAHNNRVRGTITPLASRAILDQAHEYGRRLDMFRVTVEALSASVELRLRQGDVEAAADDCKRAVALASQYGMTLRRVWLRGMAGKVFQARNDFDNARFMFERAISAAERLSFQRAVEDSSSNLMLMPHRATS